MNNKITYEIITGSVSSLVNSIARQGIVVQNARKIKGGVCLTVGQQDEKTLISHLDKLGFAYRLKCVKGLKYKLSRLLARWGIFAGLIVSIAALTLVNFMIFTINIEGNYYVLTDQIEEVLLQNGVKEFTFKSSIDVNKLRRDIVDIDGISFVSISVSGANISIVVKEELVIADVSDKSTEPIVAAYDGIVTKIVVESGTAKVKAGDTIKAGDVLIAAEYVFSDGVIVEAEARGEVYGTTYHKEVVIISPVTIERQRTGKRFTASSLYLADICVSKGKAVSFTDYDKETEEIDIDGILPLRIVKEYYYEVADVEVVHDMAVETLSAVAKSQRDYLASLPPYAEFVRSWNYIKEVDNLHTIVLYYEIEQRIDSLFIPNGS